MLIRAKELFLVWLREMRTTSGYPQSEARRMLRRFSSQLIRLFEKWSAAPAPALGLSLPMARDIVFGSLEHIVWTARVQRREDQLDVEKLSRDLATPTCARWVSTTGSRCSAEEGSQGRRQAPGSRGTADQEGLTRGGWRFPVASGPFKGRRCNERPGTRE